MSSKLKSIGVLLTNFLICIAAGHGIGPIVLIEIFSLYTLVFEGEIAYNSGNFSNFSFNNSYEDMIMYFLLFSFIGQLFFIVSHFNFFKKKTKKTLRFIGLLSMLFGFFLISKNVFNDGLAVFTLVTGILFL